MFRKLGRMAEQTNGAITEMDNIEDGLIRAVNEAGARLPESAIEYAKALRALNHFALTKPIKGNAKKLMGLD